MYLPEYSKNENQSLALKLIQDYPLGLLISAGGLQANYLPFIVEEKSVEIALLTHMAKANPHWRDLQREVLVSFQGPNHYISPTLYKDPMNVPTWNYAAVQVYGHAELISEKSAVNALLHKTVETFEARNGTSWTYDIPASFQAKLENMIIGLRVNVTRVEAKFKLSQNRTPEDFLGVMNFFKNRSNGKEMFEWMTKAKTFLL